MENLLAVHFPYHSPEDLIYNVSNAYSKENHISQLQCHLAIKIKPMYFSIFQVVERKSQNNDDINPQQGGWSELQIRVGRTHNAPP